MARRTATAEPEVTETVEAPVETVEAPKAEKVEVEFDLTEFQSAVAAATAAADTETGTVPDAEVAAVQTAFRALPSGKPKNEAKKALNEAMKVAMADSNIAGARSAWQLSEALSAPAPKQAREPKAPADPTEAFVQKVAAVQLGYSLVTANVPEGVASDWQDKVNEAIAAAQPQVEALKAWSDNEDEDKGEAPESGYVARTALKISSGKVPGAKSSGPAYTGERRDVGVHIQSAFEGKDSGTFLTVAEIRSHKSAEYGESAPSAGAISARLFPASGKCSVEGIEPGQNEKGTRGARKL